MKARHLYSLGFMNYCSHDPAACLARLSPEGRLDYIHYEEGMLSRKKKSYQFPLRAIQACLDHFHIGLDDVDVVALDYMNDKTAHNTAAYYRKLLGDYLRANLAVRHDQLHFVDSHHLAHAYTAFHPSGFASAAVLAIDGLGSEQQTHSIFDATLTGGIRHVYSQQGTGIGQLYAAITEVLGFEDGEEGKTMGLAPYGAQHADQDALLPSLRGNYQGFCVDYSRVLCRHPSSALRVSIPRCPSRAQVYSPYYARLAYNVQKELESALLHLASEIARRLGTRRLCLAGGVALNCVANELIRASGLFDEVYVQPASGDSGLCLGLALAGIEEAAARQGSGPIEWPAAHEQSFWTYAPVTFDNTELLHLLDQHGASYSAASAAGIAGALAQGDIVAYYEGGWEFGPRALGHRSFLADPRPPDMKATLNRKIKHREAYRPFAPIVPQEHFNTYFESTSERNPHMLFAVRCKARTGSVAPTVVHVDGTARVQTCTAGSGRIYDILRHFHALTGVPMLVNTSLNDNDEPIVLTPVDALSCFLRTNADALVVDDVVIQRRDIPEVAALLAAAEAMQRNDVLERTGVALRRLLRGQRQVEDPVTFLARHLLGSLHARHMATEQRLVREIFLDPVHGTGCLVTDEFHRQVLDDIAESYKIPVPFRRIEIVDDSWQALASIRKDSFLLLYNVSVLHADDEVRRAYPALRSCRSFYGAGDRRVATDRRLCSPERVMELVQTSYETDPDRSIEELFAEAVHPEFRRMYL